MKRFHYHAPMAHKISKTFAMARVGRRRIFQSRLGALGAACGLSLLSNLHLGTGRSLHMANQDGQEQGPVGLVAAAHAAKPDANPGAAVVQPGKIGVARFSADNSRVVTAGDDASARIWAITSGQLLATLHGHSGAIAYAEFSADSARVLTAGTDGTVRIWDGWSGQALLTLSGHDGPVSYAEFSPDGARVVSASKDGKGRLWDAHSGKLLGVLKGHSGPVLYARFAPNGMQIVTASADGSARFWDGFTGKPRAAFDSAK